MLLKIRTYGDEVLRQTSTEVDSFGASERMLAANMLETMYKAEGIGLAAPQVGVNVRLIVVDIGEGSWILANPKVCATQGACEMEEGCLSVPKTQVIVERPEIIELTYLDQDNVQQRVTCSGLLARAILHETDHLDGKLIVDYAVEGGRESGHSLVSDIKKEERM